jgi:hypothetical protein
MNTARRISKNEYRFIVAKVSLSATPQLNRCLTFSKKDAMGYVSLFRTDCNFSHGSLTRQTFDKTTDGYRVMPKVAGSYLKSPALYRG